MCFIRIIFKTSTDSLVVYSTEEKAVGTWVNGKTIYRKSYSASGLSLTGENVIDSTLNTNYVDHVVKIEGSMKTTTHGFLVQRDYASTTPYHCMFRVASDGLRADINNYTISNYAVTVYYTKVE